MAQSRIEPPTSKAGEGGTGKVVNEKKLNSGLDIFLEKRENAFYLDFRALAFAFFLARGGLQSATFQLFMSGF